MNISPLDHRYWAANEELFDRLSSTLSEEAALAYAVKAEAALLKVHIRRHQGGDRELLKALEGLEDRISSQEVAAEEETTQHYIRALVNVLTRKLPPALHPWVHLGATSVDILDTALAMRIRDTLQEILIPLLADLLETLTALTSQEAATPQAGRTHGQWAVPITFGFALAEYVSRLGQSLVKIDQLSQDLRGKLAGAVGAYNALQLMSLDPEALEKEYLEELGLQPSSYANQIVEPEPLLRLLLEINISFGILANMADDFRHLQRSEIGELRESFGTGQVGSSTMPQKRNPWNSEHVKSLWKAFFPRVMTFYMDQISEHQRDLSNSASGRFIPDYLAGFAAAAARMKQILTGLRVERERMGLNLSRLGNQILAEPTYILLALSGRRDAHETVRRASLEAEKTGLSLFDIIKKEDPRLGKDFARQLQKVLGVSPEDFYAHPHRYQGLAEKRARKLAGDYAQVLKKLRKGKQ